MPIIPTTKEGEPITKEWLDQRVPIFRSIYRRHADANGYLETDDYKDDPTLLSLHQDFRNKDKSGLPQLGKWNRKFPLRSGLIWLWSRGNNSGWRLRDRSG